ncbi:hypothetical protein [Paenibacillus chitinolyticus]|uniref:hypothetical protein n=1 Tax=Paenibacillus chitinolyticus TaxID=79263 RepID=UPI003670B4D5
MSYTDEDIKKMPAYVLERYAAVLIGLQTFDDFPVHAVHTYDTPTSFRVWQPTVDYIAARELQAEAVKKDKVEYVRCLLGQVWWTDIDELFQLTLQGAADLLKATPEEITKAAVMTLNKGDEVNEQIQS